MATRVDVHLSLSCPPPPHTHTEGAKVKASWFYKILASSGGGEEISLTCNLGADDLITDKSVFPRLGLSNCAGCRQRAALEQAAAEAHGVSQRRMALFLNAVLKLNREHPQQCTARHAYSAWD